MALRTRYLLSYFSRIFSISVLSIIPLIFLLGGLLNSEYSSVANLLYFHYGERNQFYYFLLFNYLDSKFLGTFNEGNFIPWLIMGNIIYTFSKHSFDAFELQFLNEKYWNTIQGTLLAPINRFSILIGYVFATLIETSIYFLFIIGISYFIFNFTLIHILQVYIIAIIITIASGGIGLIFGAINLSNENFGPIFQFLQFFILFFSCFSVPFEYFPKFLQDIIVLNPYYHATELVRVIIFGLNDLNIFISILYLIIFMIISASLGAIIYNNIWKKYGIHGY
ncbi:MAG: ABC transporter permease [Candidatus Hodarchaeota archaeon]